MGIFVFLILGDLFGIILKSFTQDISKNSNDNKIYSKNIE